MKVADINFGTMVTDVLITNNLFAVLANSALGVSGLMTGATIAGNSFIDACCTSNQGIVVSNPSTVVQVTGNSFVGAWLYGVDFQASTTIVSTQSNSYAVAVTNKTFPAATAGSQIIGGGSP